MASPRSLGVAARPCRRLLRERRERQQRATLRSESAKLTPKPSKLSTLHLAASAGQRGGNAWSPAWSPIGRTAQRRAPSRRWSADRDVERRRPCRRDGGEIGDESDRHHGGMVCDAVARTARRQARPCVTRREKPQPAKPTRHALGMRLREPLRNDVPACPGYRRPRASYRPSESSVRRAGS
jgi:hypothetical protein